MNETCDPVGNCRGTLLCPCDCGACIVHCPSTRDGDSWIDQQIAMLEALRARRHAFLQGEVPAREPNRNLLRLVMPAAVPRSPTDREGELAQTTRAKVLAVLEEENGNRTAAARRLGIQASTLYRMLSRWSGGRFRRTG